MRSLLSLLTVFAVVSSSPADAEKAVDDEIPF